MEVEDRPVIEFYGENVFSIRTMRDYLSEKAYGSLLATIRQGQLLDPDIADEVADAMKSWAISRGATHYTHWFQPLTGTTAEKHDSFIVPDQEGGVILSFSSHELIRGEPDASSFPSGGLRATFEARGYTAWDPTSPAFIKEGENGATLCIPTMFFGYHGEALDKKTPLLRSTEALSRQMARLAALFGIECDGNRSTVQLGLEQEYFLIDREYYRSRLDLLQTGRTLFGRAPAKHQQMEDHYFGVIKKRILSFMEDLDRTLWRFGIPAKTRHNEVCPAQFEIAPVYEELNLAVDHNMLLMDTIGEVAERHGLACLLHEKPFAGVNGSGKHNNWNVSGPDGKNWMKQGDNPHEDAKFLAMICAVIKAIDTHPELLRASVASAANDHRLGANEAPPAIMSIFLGDMLTDILDKIEQGGSAEAAQPDDLNIGVSSLPPLPRDTTDRNRTSPFAFTGSKFEFRAPGSSQSCADPNMVLNTIVADALDEVCTSIEQAMQSGSEFNAALQDALRGIIRRHKRVIFNGDNYTDEWRREAEKRGLPNIRTAPQALDALVAEESVAMFEKHGVLSRRELESRYEVYCREYKSVIKIEAHCAANIVKTMVLPAATQGAEALAAYITAVGQADALIDLPSARDALKDMTAMCEKALHTANHIQADADGDPRDMIDLTEQLREAADTLEGLVPNELWPLPSYAEMMFMT